MPRKPKSEEDLQIEALVNQIKEIKGKTTNQKDVDKALGMFRKGVDLFTQAIAVLEGDKPATPAPEKGKPGPKSRKKGEEASTPS